MPGNAQSYYSAQQRRILVRVYEVKALEPLQKEGPKIFKISFKMFNASSLEIKNLPNLFTLLR